MTTLPRHFRTIRPDGRAITIIEVLVGLSVLTIGILAIMAVLPSAFRANKTAELETIAGALAFMKVEEIRRDNDVNGLLISAIRNLTEPTDPVVFPFDRRLAYRFSGTTLLYLRTDANGMPIDDPLDPRDDPGVPRVIVERASSPRGSQEVLVELRFQ